MGFRCDDVDVEKQTPARRGFILNEIQLIHPTKYDSPLIEEVYKGFQHIVFLRCLRVGGENYATKNFHLLYFGSLRDRH